MTSRLKYVSFDDFTGGLNTYYPVTQLELNESPDMDNLEILPKGFKKRQGESAFCTAMNSGANVQGLGYYRPSSDTKYLIAVCGNLVYQSSGLSGTMTDIGTASGVTITSGVNNIWQQVNLNNNSIWFGGVLNTPEAPFYWDGAAATIAALGGSPPSADFAFVTRDRVFAGSTNANPSTLYWCILANSGDWTGTGSGSTTVDTNDGDRLIGGAPLNNNVALLFKRNSVHQMVTDSAPFPVKPLAYGVGLAGKNAVVNAEGTIAFVSNEPRMYVTNGYTITKASDKIDNIWDGINRSRIPYIQGIYYPTRKWIVWCVSYGSAQNTNNYAIVWDVRNQCWGRFTTGYDSNVLCLADNYRLFGGHTNGIIYEKDKADVYADASETTTAINAYWRTPWVRGESDIIAKHPRWIELNYKTQTAGAIKYSYGFDYLKDMSSGQIDQTKIGGIWDTDNWDQDFIWGGSVDYLKRIFMYGRGNNYQIRFYNDVVDVQFQVNGFSVALKQQAVKEITA